MSNSYNCYDLFIIRRFLSTDKEASFPKQQFYLCMYTPILICMDDLSKIKKFQLSINTF